MRSPRGVTATFAVFMIAATTFRAQDSVQQVKALYAAAAYEDALALAARLTAGSPNLQIEQYRVFCLIALGRDDAANAAIESVVLADPWFEPDPAETSPRIREAFNRKRRQMVPAIARGLYQDGKSALERKDRTLAVMRFEEVLRLIDGVRPEDGNPLAELRLVAAGFLELSRALPVPPVEPLPPLPAATTPAAAPTSAGVTEPPDRPPTTSRKEAEGGSATPQQPIGTSMKAPDPAPEGRVAITPPVPLSQDLPAWTPPDEASGRGSYRGTVRVFISEAGNVTAAELVRPVHPAYDRLLMEAVKSWRYEPARRGAVAVRSEKLVDVQLRPQ